MKIYDLLLNNRRPHLISVSREYLFAQEHEQMLNAIPDYLPFLNPKDDFSLININILILSLQNYEKINLLQSKDENIMPNDQKIDPLFIFNEVPIYCPLFSFSHNLLIGKGLGGNLNLNYDVIDIFETYNFALYESNMTSLVLVGQDSHSRAYYHYDFHTIYIVNDQGRLDNRICLFDKHIKKPDYRNIIERIGPVIKAYYDNDRLAFLNALIYEKFISQKLFNTYFNYLKRRKIV